MLVLRGSQIAHCAECRLMSQEKEASSSFCEHDVLVESAFLQFYSACVLYCRLLEFAEFVSRLCALKSLKYCFPESGSLGISSSLELHTVLHFRLFLLKVQ